MVRAFQKLVEPLQRRIRLMVGRAVVRVINDGLKLQGVQISLLADEVRDEVERFQEYGFTSHPLPGAEAIAVCVGGSRDHAVVISVDDRRYRLKGLAQGEVALYTDEGDVVHLRRSKELLVKSGNRVTVEAAAQVLVKAPLITVKTDSITIETLTGGTPQATLKGNLRCEGNVEVIGNITASGSIVDVTGNTNHHTH